MEITVYKNCKKCNLSKPLGKFLDCLTTKDKKQSWCRECQRLRSMEYYIKNKNEQNEKRRALWKEKGI